MTSSRLATQQIPATVGGVRFIWRDETNTLEQIGGSNVTFTEGVGSRQQRRQKASEKKKDRESICPTRLTQFPVGGSMLGSNTNSFRERYSNLPKYITMQDIKAIALSKLSAEGGGSDDLYDSPLVDEMIACTLKFFDCYFKMEENNKPRPMMAEQSTEEAEREARDQERLVEAHKMLSSVYGAVLLGHRNPDTHHLCAGKLRYSKTRKDKDFYESLYQCLTYCACLTFEEADPDVIKTEMGRLFRSDSFNINQRELSQKELEEKYPDYFKLKGLSDPNSGPSAAEYRRLRSKRSPFGKAINMHSPMVEAMLNNPQHVIGELTSSEMTCYGIGIIGKTIKDYDLSTLRKLGEKEKKELELNENFTSRSSSVAGLDSREPTSAPDSAI
ncbi:hypothetical protein ACHWQZ_G001318 [Mnemiopsis leidyi]